MDGPLDFEDEDALFSPPVVPKKRKKIIGLDDLLTDFYREKSKCLERESKREKAPQKDNSDDDEDDKEALVCKAVDECQKQMTELIGEEEISMWGIRLFGDQKTPPPLIFPELRSSLLLQSFMENELSTLVELPIETGEVFLESLLLNGWLSKLIISCGHLEKSIASWTFNMILYSSREELRASACDLWHLVLSSKAEVASVPIKIDWFPGYSELRRALETYGFLFSFSSTTESVDTNSACQKPSQNIKAWVEISAACCQARSKKPIFSTSEAEELVQFIICLFLDRQLMGLQLLFYECTQSVINYFTDEEWTISSKRIAKSLAFRVPMDLNCLRAVECISGVGPRSKGLRSAVAYEVLCNCLNCKAANEEEILSLLISINVKDRSCDLFKMYIYLVLTENWLMSTTLLEEKPVLYEMWSVYLRNCSCQITSTDMRSYAPKVRNKASYLLQGTIK
ncbi:hypothetical protein HS088_TW22G01166 [Tripterygium wilfordii]|uniref:Coiled-coil SMC6 And NSE5 INteracting (CANIN) domain-containing protein n=1 Tax=Tripterygium wilfordii TaxID=458696 RepID=A0A7J7C021_TRIWF|nr:uncharacterized protein LOC119990776 [Tripterygium wilfordii]KAF5727473.1 hypothetical protein HS088_TW22G01166 [Tripterygium wilfordii]